MHRWLAFTSLSLAPQAGVPNVLSLPPNAAAAWARYKAASAAAAAARDPTHSPFASRAERLRQAAKWSSDPARTARLAEAIAATDPYNTPLLDMPLSVAESAAAATSAAAAGAVSGGGDPLVRAQAEAVTAQQLREPTGYLWSCRAVLQPDPQRCPGLPERVVLALREGPDSAELAQVGSWCRHLGPGGVGIGTWGRGDVGRGRGAGCVPRGSGCVYGCMSWSCSCFSYIMSPCTMPGRCM